MPIVEGLLGGLTWTAYGVVLQRRTMRQAKLALSRGILFGNPLRSSCFYRP